MTPRWDPTLTPHWDPTGTPPVEQAKEVWSLFQAKRRLEAARKERDRRRTALGGRAGKVFEEAQARVSLLAERVAELAAKYESSKATDSRGARRWGKVQAKMTSAHGRFLPVCFVTFGSSRAARTALGAEVVAALGKLGVSVGAAPRPTDIKFEHLHRRTDSLLVCLCTYVAAGTHD